MSQQWLKRFSTYINLVAKHGPYAKALRSLHKRDIEEAIADITWQTKCRTYNRQQACKHLKGGNYRPLQVKDYAITIHTFIDSRTRLKCMLCGVEAWSNSGMDFKYNWLKSLAEQSTNWPSASEQVLLEVRRGKILLATFPNTETGRTELRKQFPNWDGTYTQPGYDPPKEDDTLKIPEGHSPIKGALASTLESAEGVIVVAQDLLYSGSPDTEGAE